MQYLTVSALNKYLRYKFEKDENLNEVYIKGEISNYKLHQKGIFLTLKDSNSSIQAYISSNLASEVSTALGDGVKVLARGRVSVYVPYGSYRIMIDKIELDGIGELYLKLEALRKKLELEGLFDKPKKALPRYPKVVGVITSKTGAVIEDIKKTVNLRYPLARIVLYPATVQGPDSKTEIVEKIELANNDDVDVLIIGRGGGSIEDLWAFNEEIVVRAISNSKIPIISAIGHETDTTLSDLVSDLRASTPTGAAMSATPDSAELSNNISKLRDRLNNNMNIIMNNAINRLNNIERIIYAYNPVNIFKGYQERLLSVNKSLSLYKESYFSNLELRLNNVVDNLNKINLNDKINDQIIKLNDMNLRLDRNIDLLITRKEESFSFLIEKLKTISPFNLLDKGYSVASKNGQIIKSINDVKVKDNIEIRVKDGIIKAEVK